MSLTMAWMVSVTSAIPQIATMILRDSVTTGAGCTGTGEVSPVGGGGRSFAISAGILLSSLLETGAVSARGAGMRFAHISGATIFFRLRAFRARVTESGDCSVAGVASDAAAAVVPDSVVVVASTESAPVNVGSLLVREPTVEGTAPVASAMMFWMSWTSGSRSMFSKIHGCSMSDRISPQPAVQ